MPTASKPTRLNIRMYQVGFGDCFLLSFEYKGKPTERHVLIDFGSTAKPKFASTDLMLQVAKDIKERCNGKLHAIVATHRHADHISGFATDGKGTGTGDIIASCEPDVIVQPWTEHPQADPDTGTLKGMAANRFAFVSALQNMHEVSQLVLTEASKPGHKFGNALTGGLTEASEPGHSFSNALTEDLTEASEPEHRFSNALTEELRFLGEDNIKNKSAVENLMKMGETGKAVYVHYGTKSGLEKVLPGVKITVLGPPTLEQSDKIRSQRSKDETEYWHFQALAGQHLTGGSTALFPAAPAFSGHPPYARWFVKRLKRVRGEQLLGIMRALDKVMNNTSIILLFEAGKKKLLFPGDAQIENWSYALEQEETLELLKDVHLYKVGHHGSLNATPKTVWNNFAHRSEEDETPDRLQTLLSSMAGKHGKATKGTEVPRHALVKALDAESHCTKTQDLKTKTKFWTDITIEF